MSRTAVMLASLLCVLCAMGLAFGAWDIVRSAGGSPWAAGSAATAMLAIIAAIFSLLIRRSRKS